MSTLYIIGNGFDLHHGVKSSYWAFGQFLKSRDEDTYAEVERYFDVDDMFWAEFEDRLASFDSETLVEHASTFLLGYGHPEWRDSANHHYQNEIDAVVRTISKTMRARFEEWIRQLKIPRAQEIASLVPIDKDAIFLNFNYTASLQQIYGVSEAQIKFIHGSAEHSAELVLGHGWKQPSSPDPYRIASNPEDADIREVQGQSIIDRYFADTFKPTDAIIARNRGFFQALSTVDTVRVMGHSVSEVDHAYFAEVRRSVDLSKTQWTFSYYDGLEALKDRVMSLDIPLTKVAFAKLTERAAW